MKRTLLSNCRIVNPYGIIPFIENGYILIEDGSIGKIGSGRPDITLQDVVDLHGKTVLPGMINAHAHLYSSLALGMPFPENIPPNFIEKLKTVWWILDRALDEESTKASFEIGLLEHLENGVTTVIDHHSSQNFIPGSLDQFADIAENIGMNISGAFEITDRNGKATFRQSLDENIRYHQKFAQNTQIRPLIGLHASFTLSDESLKYISEKIHTLSNWGIHIHVSEDKADELDANNRGYNSVIQRLHSFDLLNENSLVIHGTHLHPGDVVTIIESAASLVHNPTSNANNRVGMTPNSIIEELSAGLGTDGMQSSMLKEAKEGSLIRSSHLQGGKNSVNYDELLFKNNPAIASNLFGLKIGKIDPGYAADLAIFDYHPKTELHENNCIGHILFGLEKPSDVMTRGEFRIRDDKCVTLDAEKIRNNAENQSKRLWLRMIEKENH